MADSSSGRRATLRTGFRVFRMPGAWLRSQDDRGEGLTVMSAVRRACSARSTMSSGASCPAAISRPASAARPPGPVAEAGSSAVIVWSSLPTPAALIVTATRSEPTARRDQILVGALLRKSYGPHQRGQAAEAGCRAEPRWPGISAGELRVLDRELIRLAAAARLAAAGGRYRRRVRCPGLPRHHRVVSLPCWRGCDTGADLLFSAV